MNRLLLVFQKCYSVPGTHSSPRASSSAAAPFASGEPRPRYCDPPYTLYLSPHRLSTFRSLARPLFSPLSSPDGAMLLLHASGGVGGPRALSLAPPRNSNTGSVRLIAASFRNSRRNRTRRSSPRVARTSASSAPSASAGRAAGTRARARVAPPWGHRAARQKRLGEGLRVRPLPALRRPRRRVRVRYRPGHAHDFHERAGELVRALVVPLRFHRDLDEPLRRERRVVKARERRESDETRPPLRGDERRVRAPGEPGPGVRDDLVAHERRHRGLHERPRVPGWNERAMKRRQR